MELGGLVFFRGSGIQGFKGFKGSETLQALNPKR